MAGQVQILEINKDSLFEKFSNTLLKQADLLYLKEKFAIQSEYNQSKAFHAYLMQEVLCTNNCELINYVEDKIAGRLEDTVRKSRQTRLQELIQKLAKQNKQIEDEIEQKVFWSDTQW